MTALTLTRGDVTLLMYAGIVGVVGWFAWQGAIWLFWRLVDGWASEQPAPRWAAHILPDPFLEPDHGEAETVHRLRQHSDGNGRTQMLASWSTAAAGLPLEDHVECEGEDCDQIICCCADSRGVDRECPGTTTLGCPHHNLLCWDHRLHCTDCRIEARAEADAEAERHWIGVRR